MNEKPILTDEIDARIEKRLPLFRDSIELKLIRELDAGLKARIDSSVKVLGGALTLITLVFAILGVRTFLDIKNLAIDTARSAVRETLDLDNPNSGTRREVDRIITRSLIDSYLISLAKNKNDQFRPDLYISDTDTHRLQSVLLQKDTPERDFIDALKILMDGETGEKERVDRLLQALAKASEPDHQWIIQQPEKRAAIFASYPSDQLTEAARTILDNVANPKPLLIAAIKYSARRNDANHTVRQLEGLASANDEEVGSQALNALAQLQPSSARVRAVLEKPKSTKQHVDWIAAIRLAVSIERPASWIGPSSKDERSLRLQLQADLLRAAFKEGYIFIMMPNIYSGNKRLGISLNGQYSQYLTNVNFLSDSDVLDFMIKTFWEDSVNFALISKAICMKRTNKCIGAIKVDLSNGGKILLSNGAEIDADRAPSGVILHTQTVANAPVIIAKWTDIDTALKTSSVGTMEDVGKMQFTLALNQRVAEEW